MKQCLWLLLMWSLNLHAFGTGAVKDAAWVKARAMEWQPTPADKRWESIGWATKLSDALRLAKTSRRPVFLFTLDGKMAVGRC